MFVASSEKSIFLQMSHNKLDTHIHVQKFGLIPMKPRSELIRAKKTPMATSRMIPMN